MEVDDTGNVEVSLKTGAVSDTANSNVDDAVVVYEVNQVGKEALEKNNSNHSLTPKSLRKNKLTGHDGGLSSQQLWVHELDSDDSTSPSFIDTSSASSKSEEGSGMDNKSVASAGSLATFLENHAHLLPIPLQKRQSSIRTIKASGSKRPSFTVDNLEGTDPNNPKENSTTHSGNTSLSSLQLMNFQDTLRSAGVLEGPSLNVLGYDSDDDDLDKILGPAKQNKHAKQSKTLSAWNANIATAIAARQGKRTISRLPPTPEEPMKLKKEKNANTIPRIQESFSEVDHMDYSTASASSHDRESDLVYEHGDSQRDPLEKYRMRRKRRCFRIALRAVVCTMVALVVTAVVLVTLVYFKDKNEGAQAEDTQDADAWIVNLPVTPSQQPSRMFSLEPSPNPTSIPSASPETPSGAPTVETSSVPTILFSTQRPSKQPTETPSMMPSTSSPTRAPMPPTIAPTKAPSKAPTSKPTDSPTFQPTKWPTPKPTGRPTTPPTPPPTGRPTAPPTKWPTPNPDTVEDLITNFYVIGDLPYNDQERDRLIHHVNTIPPDAEFLVHVGDIRDGENRENCKRSEFNDVANILKQSPVPVFIVPGDNEYNDCPNLDTSWGEYLAEFGSFEQHWDTQLRVSRDPVKEENFFFVHKRVLYIGLNVVGGWRHDYAEWERRLDMGWRWARNLIEAYIRPVPSEASTIVIFAHADPRASAHAPFFEPLKNYIRNDLKNEVPILYINGDQHYWQFDSNFYGEPSFHRLMVEGGSKEPALKMTMIIPNNPYQGALEVNDVYSYDRRL